MTLIRRERESIQEKGCIRRYTTCPGGATSQRAKSPRDSYIYPARARSYILSRTVALSPISAFASLSPQHNNSHGNYSPRTNKTTMHPSPSSPRLKCYYNIISYFLHRRLLPLQWNTHTHDER